MASVVYTAMSSSSIAVPVDTLPPADAVVYLLWMGTRSTPRTITVAPSGLGATWTEIANDGTTRYTLWKGEGATTTGQVNATLSGTTTGVAAVYVVTGLTDPGTVTVHGATTVSGVTLAGPSQAADAGQAVLAVHYSANPHTFPSAQIPAGAYTAFAPGGGTSMAYATPAAADTYRVDSSTPGSVIHWTAQVVVGTEGTNPPIDVAGAYASEVAADAPLVYWRLGETSGTVMRDSSGRNRHGAYDGAVGLAAAGSLPGDADTACTFPGSLTAYGSIPFAAWANVPSLTVEARIKTTATDGAVVDRDVFGAGLQRPFQFRLVAGKIEFLRITNAAGTVAVATATSPGVVNDGAWHSVAATYDGSTILLYVDGALVTTTAAAGGIALPTSGPKLAVGINFSSSGGGGSSAFNGAIDEVAYYGTALSGARLAAHHAAAATKGADNWANATVVVTDATGLFESDLTSNATFTSEDTEPNAVNWAASRSAWWAYTPATSGTARFDTQRTTSGSSDADSQMGVYTGAALNALTTVASDQDSGDDPDPDGYPVGKLYTSRITGVAVTAGVTYWIQVGAYASKGMSYGLRVKGPATAAAGPVEPPPPVEGTTVTWWDGAALQPATAAGWWDGAALQPVTMAWWDGATEQPLS